MKEINKIFINFLTDKCIYDMNNKIPIENLTILNNLDFLEIIVLNFPGSYSKIRKSIVTAKAIEVCIKNSKSYGFSLFDYFNYYSPYNFFIDKFAYWREDKFGPSESIEEFIDLTKQYISNEPTPYSTPVPCDSLALIEFIEKTPSCLSPLKQIYHDRFSS